MSTTAGSYAAGTMVALLFFSTAVEAGDPVRGERLFRITRNKNDNIVCYDVLQKNGKLDKDNPVSVYWVIPSKKNALEELNWIERKKAYGIEVVKAFGQDSVDIRLKAGKKSLRVAKRNTRWVALTTVDSREVAVDSVYVMATESGATPTVQWVDLVGRNTATGESVWKRITE
jgi:histidyl-tRNA synthetase